MTPAAPGDGAAPKKADGEGDGGKEAAAPEISAVDQKMLDELLKLPKVYPPPKTKAELRELWKKVTPKERKEYYDYVKKQVAEDEKDDGKEQESVQASARAVIVVNLPADARLTINGRSTSSTSATRVLASPQLPLGQSFYYTLRAEVVRDGQTLATTQRVTVRGGYQTRVTLRVPTGEMTTSR
jgi:uncharacterized protein (TIGR03000 family)